MVKEGRIEVASMAHIPRADDAMGLDLLRSKAGCYSRGL